MHERDTHGERCLGDPGHAVGGALPTPTEAGASPGSMRPPTPKDAPLKRPHSSPGDGAPPVAKARVVTGPRPTAPMAKAVVTKAPAASGTAPRRVVVGTPAPMREPPAQGTNGKEAGAAKTLRPGKAPITKRPPSHRIPDAGGGEVAAATASAPPAAAPPKATPLLKAAPKGSPQKPTTEPKAATAATSSPTAETSPQAASASPEQLERSPSPTGPSSTLKRADSWRDFSDTDPFYALLGELGTNKVVRENGSIDEEVLHGYIQRLVTPGVLKKPKDWVEVWSTMGIPIEGQSQVCQAILQLGLESELATSIPEVMAELIKGHRVKVKAVEEAVQTLFECGDDSQGVLANMLLIVFPKSPTSEWGWSRVGWNWQQWWGFADRVLSTLDGVGAFDALSSLLAAIEAKSGSPLVGQQIWDETRLTKVRAALCRFGGLAEDELPAHVSVALS